MILNKIKINDTATVTPGVVYDISKATGQSYDTLSDALSGNNVPLEVREGGMSVRFVTSDNKYVQYRLMSDTFNTTVTNWQGVDNEPTAGSENLVKSGGIEKAMLTKRPLFTEVSPTIVNDYYIKSDGTQSTQNNDGRYYASLPVSAGDVMRVSGYNLNSSFIGAYVDVFGHANQIIFNKNTSSSFSNVVAVINYSGTLYVNGNSRYGYNIKIEKQNGYDQNSEVIYQDVDNLKVEVLSLPNKAPLFNVTYEVPLPAGQYYTFTTAKTTVPEAARKTGLIITFRTKVYDWETWQFISVTSNWADDDYWQKLSLSSIKECFDVNNQERHIGQEYITITAINGDYKKLLDSNGDFIPLALRRMQNTEGTHRLHIMALIDGEYKNISVFYSNDQYVYTGEMVHELKGDFEGTGQIAEKWINFEVRINWDLVQQSPNIITEMPLNTAYFYKQLVERKSVGNLSGLDLAMFGASNVSYAASGISIDQRLFWATGVNANNCGFEGNSMAIRQFTGTEPYEGYYADLNSFCMANLVDVICAVNTGETVTIENITYDKKWQNLMEAAMRLRDNVGTGFTYYVRHARNLAHIDFTIIDMVCTIAYGGGDWSGNVPEGINDSFDKTTFKGAMNYVIRELHKKYPHIKLLFLTPLYRVDGVFTPGADSDVDANNEGLCRWSYGEFMKEIGKLHHQYVFDMYYQSGRDKYNTWDLYKSDYDPSNHDKNWGLTSDGVHANVEGQKQEANIYAGILAQFG